MDVQEHRVALALLEPGRPGDPGLHLGSVLRDRGEPLGLDEAAAGRELLADLGHLLVADVELAEIGRRRAGPDDLAVADVVSGKHDLASGQKLRLAAGGRHLVDVDVPCVLDREDDVVAVPDRLAQLRVGVAGAVERGREDAPVLPGLRIDDGDLGVARVVEAAGRPLHRQQRAVR